jgi:hypothetical protein
MAVCRAIILVCHAVSAVVAVVIIGAGQTLTTAWGCYGSVPLADMNLGCCGDDPSLPWVVDNDPMPICRTVDCTTSPPVTKWFGPAAAMAMHMQVMLLSLATRVRVRAAGPPR